MRYHCLRTATPRKVHYKTLHMTSPLTALKKWLKRMFTHREEAVKNTNEPMFLIVGLGNIGAEYADTRHNMGFKVVDKLAADAGASWEDRRYGFVTTIRVKNQQLLLLKPSTYMNLSGNAVRYWMKEKKIDISQLLVISDDLALPFGTLRMKPSGSEGGHNGLRHITQILGTQKYARLRFGIGNDFARGAQVDFVLGGFTPEEQEKMDERLATAADFVRSFALEGMQRAMNKYNGK